MNSARSTQRKSVKLALAKADDRLMSAAREHSRKGRVKLNEMQC